MRVPHIYQPSAIFLNTPVALDDDAAGHVGRVLRMQVGDKVSIFNGEGGEYLSEIIEVSKKNVVVVPQEFVDHDVESPLKIHLGQGISRGDKMDLASYLLKPVQRLGKYSLFLDGISKTTKQKTELLKAKKIIQFQVIRIKPKFDTNSVSKSNLINLDSTHEQIQLRVRKISVLMQTINLTLSIRTG